MRVLILLLIWPALSQAQRPDFLASRGGEIELLVDLDQEPFGRLPVSPDGWLWQTGANCGNPETMETHTYAGRPDIVQLAHDASTTLLMEIEVDRVHFRRLSCTELDADPLPEPILDLPLEYPLWPNFICDLRSLPDGRVCIWSSPMDRQCDGGQPQRDGFRWMCADPSDPEPAFETVFSMEDLVAAQPHNPGIVATVPPIEFVRHNTPNRLLLPDGTQIVNMLKSFVPRAMPGGNGRPRGAAVYTLLQVSLDGEITPIITHFSTFQQMGYDAERNAVLFGPFEGFEWDDRQIGVRGSGGNPGSQRGRFHGVGVVVVPLDPAERGRYGVLSLSEQLYSAFPEIDWTDANSVERPRFGADRGVLHLQLGNRLYRPIWDPAEVDLDFDGLSGAEEAALGTSDYDVDSDGGGVMDHTEAWLLGTDPSDRLDDPAPNAVPLHFSHSPLIAQLCRAGHSRVARDPTAPTITGDGAIYVTRSESGETTQIAPPGTASGYEAPVAFATADGVFIASQRAPYPIAYVAPGQAAKPLWDLEAAGVAGGHGVHNGPAALNEANHIPHQVFELRPIGVIQESGHLLVETRGTMNTHVVALHPDHPPAPVMNKQQVGNLANGLFTRYGRLRFDFPSVFRPTGGGEYLTELGALTPWLHAANTTARGFSTQFNAQFAVPFEAQQWVRMERTIEPGDTLLLAGVARTGTPSDLDGPLRGEHMLYKIGPLGGFVPMWDAPFRYLNQVVGLGADSTGRVCVVDITGELFEFVPPATDSAGNIPTVGGANGVIEGIRDCAYAPNGDLFLLDDANKQILRFERATDETVVESPLPATGTYRTLGVGPDGTPTAFDHGGLWLSDGDLVTVGGDLSVNRANRGIGSLAETVALAQPGTVPDDMVMHLAERPDGMWSVLGQTPEWRPQPGGPRPAAQPISLYVFDPVTGTSMQLTGGNIVGNVDYANQAIAAVPGGVRRHPCTLDALPPGQTPISLLQAASTDEPAVPSDPDAVQPSENLRGTPIPLQKEGCQQAPTSGWAGLFLLLALVRRRQR